MLSSEGGIFSMKKDLILILLLVLCSLPCIVTAQDKILPQKDNIFALNSPAELMQLNELKKIKMEVDLSEPEEKAEDAAFFGIYPVDLDFTKAQELNYPYNYGILITGIVDASPAYIYRLAEDDILMEIDGKKVLNLKEFDKIEGMYRAGDAVNLKIYREGEIKELDFVFGTNPENASAEEKENCASCASDKHKSVGYGGGSWLPVFYALDLDDINSLLKTLNFSTLPDDGLLALAGFGGKGSIGKGWFLGFQFQTYDEYKKKSAPQTGFLNIVDYDYTTWNITLDKRFALLKNLIASAGVGVGRGVQSLNLVHTNGDFEWGIPPESNYSVTYKKSYAVVQPKVELQVRLLSWFGIRGEVGYLYGYSPTKGWKQSYSNAETFEVNNSPDTPLEGLTFSVGPWFGF